VSERRLLVMLGASEFPRAPNLTSAKAFARSHDALRSWLCGRDPPFVAPDDVLDLFDSHDNSNALDDRIASFLDERAPGAAELLVVYVGHGGFKESKDYFLAIQATRADNPFFSSLPIESLCRTIRSHARSLRRYFLIDACFSAAATKGFQSAELADAVRAKMEQVVAAEDVPEHGTALLTSSSRSDVSLFDENGKTQFMQGLLEVLDAGDPAGGAKLSLADVHRLLRATLVRRFDDRAVMPELHAPEQSKGALTDVPLFPNEARKPRVLPFVAVRSRGESDVPLQVALGAPQPADRDRSDRYLIERPQYVLSYNEPMGRANWVSWHIHRSDLGSAPRGSHFAVDPALPASFTKIHPAMYRNSGYDRGHLVSPRARKASDSDQRTVHFMTNVIPQAKVRNQNLWSALEHHCQDLVQLGHQCFVQAGPGGSLGMLPGGPVAIPQFMWKVVVVLPEDARATDADESTMVIAVRMANLDQTAIEDWRECQTSVASIEDELGFRFFTNLPKPIARELKRRISRTDETPGEVRVRTRRLPGS
jgi:endonuclease G